MDANAIVGLIALCLAGVTGIALLIYFVRAKQEPHFRHMMGAQAPESGGPAVAPRRGTDNADDPFQDLETAASLEEIREKAKKASGRKQEFTLEEKLFQAGIVTEKQRREFQRLRFLSPAIVAPLLSIPLFFAGPLLGIVGLVLGLLVGMQLPFSILDRRIARRDEDLMFFLPLVIEQIAIGVSSSLDVGPCLQRIVTLADERDSHNPVTELIRHALFYIKSGVSFEDAMVETGKASGHTELKHAFMFLAQVAKHGGEITKQLQELANAVSSQRETYIEEKIRKLELTATGPVTLVFFGFMIILLSGFGSQLMKAF